MSDWQQISAGLSAQFPRASVHWRAQAVTPDGTKGLALAYIDARDVMERLDEIVGPENWQDSYVETPKGRLICTLSIRCGGEWVAKSDGAGDTDVEGDKGAISDALKRAAVKWGVGRYLYDMPATWVPCESYEAGGKRRWRKWKDGVDPWSFVRGPAPAAKDRNADLAHAPDTTLHQKLIPECRAILGGSTTSAIALKAAWQTVQSKCKQAGLSQMPPELTAYKDELKATMDAEAKDNAENFA